MTEPDLDYAPIDHTADIGVEVRGKDFADLLVHAGEALFSVITDISTVEPKTRKKLRVDAGSPEEVLRGWLDKLLAQFNRKDMMFSRFSVTLLANGAVEAEAWGELLNAQRHTLHTEIKGITYHQFQVRRDPATASWTAQIIFDV